MTRRWIVLPWLLSALAGCSDGYGGPDVCEEDPCACERWPDVPTEPVRDPAVAFDVWREGVVERHEWHASAGDTIECRALDCEQSIMAITFAAQGGAPRLELEACGFGRDTLLRPLESPSFPECGPGVRGFVARWSDGEVWRSEPSSPTCRLNATKRDGELVGTFECGLLRSDAGTEVRLGTGSFECTLEF